MKHFKIDSLDDVIHGRVRLGIMAFLSTAECADFTEIKERLSLTDGNLSVHLRKLEEAGYVAVEKSFAGRKPQTRIKLRRKGREAFVRYLEAMSELIERSRS